MRPRVIELILDRCLGRREGESVLIVTDAPMEPAALAFQRGAITRGVETSLVSMSPRRFPGEEPPRAVAEALKSCPIAILLTSTSIAHTQARREACEQHGVRIASMPGADVARLEGLLDIDYAELGARVEEIARLLEGGRRVRLTTRAGTDLRFDITGRPIHRDSGDLTRPGAFGNLPAGEIYVMPLEGTAEGLALIDGSIRGMGRVGEPLALRFVGGRAQQVGNDRLRALLEPHGPDACALKIFGIGANPRALVGGNLLEDKKSIGTAHLSLGGVVEAVLLDVRVEVDDRAIPEKFLTPPGSPAATDLGRVNITSETYRTLFEHSNDAQVVLDLESQQFLEANPGFERLSGYAREELLSGTVTFSKLVARESYPTYLKKRQTRRSTPAERYDLKLQTKTDEKKPVELSVRLMTLSGRELVLVSIRDLSQRKRVEQEMWAKIEELGHANSRIYALTEKIRRVPELTPQLLHITDEEELLESAARLLCAREGLGYAEVSFYLLRDDGLELAYSTVKTRKRKMKLPDDHPLVRILKGEDPGSTVQLSALLPLKGRDRNLGVMEVSFHPKEIEVLEGNERAIKGYRDVLTTLSNMIGLLVENLQLYQMVRRQSIMDSLTGVYNRRYFDAKLAEETHRAGRYGRHLTLYMIDIDHFAEFNNTMGHKQGDIILAETARILRAQTRDVDSVCRFGGDEFAILMPETSYENGMGKADALRQTVRKTDFPNATDPAHPAKVTLSIGVTGFHPGIKNGDELLKAADEALYAAKDAGRDAVRGVFKDIHDARP